MPIQVTVVRPSMSGSDLLKDFVEAIGTGLLKTWFAMLLLGALHIHINRHIPALGFWEVLGIRLAIQCIWPVESFAEWTKRSGS